MKSRRIAAYPSAHADSPDHCSSSTLASSSERPGVRIVMLPRLAAAALPLHQAETGDPVDLFDLPPIPTDVPFRGPGATVRDGDTCQSRSLANASSSGRHALSRRMPARNTRSFSSPFMMVSLSRPMTLFAVGSFAVTVYGNHIGCQVTLPMALMEVRSLPKALGHPRHHGSICSIARVLGRDFSKREECGMRA